MGPNECRGVVCVDGVRDLGRYWNRPSGEDAAHRAAGDFLQSPVAHSCGVPTVVKGHADGFTRGRYHLAVLVGDIAYRCGAVGLRVRELSLQAQESRTNSFVAVSGKHYGP